MMTGYLRQDESSHWYLVPSDKITEFDDAMREIEMLSSYTEEWHASIDQFIDLYSQYRTGGGVGHLEVVIP